MSRVAIRYAKAVLETALNAQKADSVATDMELIEKTIVSSKELQEFLKNPIIKPETKESALLEVFVNTTPETKRLFSLLLSNKRFEILQNIAQEYHVLFNENKGYQAAEVITATALDATLEAKVIAIAKQMSPKEIKLTNSIDPSIIGGYILRIGDQQYNASVKNNLQKIAKEFAS